MPRVVLVTGSTSGLGLDIARAFVAAGDQVVLNGRDEQRVHAARDQLVADVPDARVVGLAADISDPASAAALVAQAEAELGPVDVLVHAAVLRAESDTVGTTDEEWRSTLGVTLDGAFFCTRAVLPGMQARGAGRIVYLGGISAELGLAGRVALVAAKNAVFGLTKAVAAEAGPYGVTVNCVSPGVIDNHPAGGEDDRSRQRSALVARSALRRAGHTSDVVAAVVYLAGEGAGYITGQRLSVSGGTSVS